MWGLYCTNLRNPGGGVLCGFDRRDAKSEKLGSPHDPVSWSEALKT